MIGTGGLGHVAIQNLRGLTSAKVIALDLDRAGAIDLHVERHGVDEAPEAHARLHDGKVDGRAVVVPG